jgi:hypothetical protein
VLDDVSPLRQLDAQSSGAAAWLARPADAVRFRPSEFTGSPMPHDEPMAPNPPFGAAVYYHLRADAQGPIVLRIEDALGQTVRRYSSADRAPARERSKIDTAPEWYAAAEPLATAAGLHRFVWDLHYAPAAGRRADDPLAEGVWAAPGRYFVVLEAAGLSLRAALELKPDPRATLPAADYARAFATAAAIEAMRGRIADAARAAEALHGSLLAAAQGADASLADALRAAAVALQGIADLDLAKEDRGAVRPEPTNLAGLRALAAEGGKLARAVGGADGAPTADAAVGSARFLGMGEAALTAWTAFKNDTVAALDARLASAGRPPLAAAQ